MARISRIFGFGLIALVLLAGSAATAQENTASTREQAEVLIQQGRWEEAAEAWEVVTGSESADARSWAYLGMAYRHLGRADDAITAYDRAIKLDENSFMALAGKAIVLEQQGEVDQAFEFLTRLAESGAPLGLLEQEEAFAGLREHEQFKEVVKIAERAADPCLRGGPYDDFDFWLGDWDVLIGGQKRAENKITKEMKGCIVRERFHNTFGYEGESVNYYDPETGQWKQNWVDVKGGVVRYAGGLEKEGVMHMEGANTSSRGETQLARVTWTRLPDGRVHHVIEQSIDGGKSWQIYFDGIYVRSDRAVPD